MGSIPDQFPISLRAWPSEENSVNALPSLISRINFERGDFRNVSEESLREEIRQIEAGTGANAEDDGSSDEEEEQPDRLKELMTAREEMVMQIEQAHTATIFALDFVSLLLSKDTPVQASSSISPIIRDAVGMGTLGADKVQASRVSETQKQDNMRIAKGWKIQNINKSVESILASATRLEQEIESETKYWEQVLAVSEKGWAVCRLPQERHTLGVRFGFSEAAPTFKNRSLAALRRNPDGSVYLDQGVISSGPHQLRVRIRTDGVETGEVSLASAVPADAAIEDFILQARNTIFNEELWQELNRESRTLASYGVRAHETMITCPISPSKTMVLDLVPMEEATSAKPGADNNLAEGLSLVLKILLGYTHRKNYRRRIKPQPPISALKRPNPPYDLLRPIITRLSHQDSLTSLNRLFSSICRTLQSTGLAPTPNYTIATTSAGTSNELTAAENIIITLLDRLEVTTTLTLTPSLTLTIKSRTAQYLVGNPHQGGMAGTIHLPSISTPSPLPETFKVPPNLHNFEEVKDFVYWVVSCGLATAFVAENGDETSIEAAGKLGWYATSQANVLRKSFEGKGRSKQLCFDVKEGEKLEVRWEWLNGANTGKATRKLMPGEGLYNWQCKNLHVNGEIEEVVKSLDDVVEEAGKWIVAKNDSVGD
ncbi:hypothetical protein BP5796_09536 [Coleophoma crateriformis]|uniref:Mediator of RNA polymerase II transcription subunit 17 n=1 Tax=Coleophoma crateriformis TaxID=565419 RepID=A0A3D8QYE1_9HELO|nr:hypothetical protein BP5796_09536 [Coleophoma crateriformis]